MVSNESEFWCAKKILSQLPAQRTVSDSRSVGEYLVSTSFSARDLYMTGWKASVFDANWTRTAPRPVMLASTTTSVSCPMTYLCNTENSLSESCSLGNGPWHFPSQAQTFSLSFCRKGWTTILAKVGMKRSVKPAISRKERNTALHVCWIVSPWILWDGFTS